MQRHHSWIVFALSLTMAAAVGACDAEGPDDFELEADELEDEDLEDEDLEAEASLVAEEELEPDEELEPAGLELDPADELRADDPTMLVVPSLQVEFAGCIGSSPTFVVNWGGSGGPPTTYDVDLATGLGSFQPFYDGPDADGVIYWGSQNRNDTFRVRLCSAGSCGGYVSRSTGQIDCGQDSV